MNRFFVLCSACAIILIFTVFTIDTSTAATVKYNEDYKREQDQQEQRYNMESEQQQQEQEQEQQQQQSTQQLPFCDETNDDGLKKPNRKPSNRFLYVSTLDGKISALDILNGGQMKWSISTTPGPMISSSIHNLELTNNGQWVRMIPSLSGALYKFDGETVEPIPINAENLLSSSYKFSDDLVISGGKETISYGVSAHSGKIIYECSMHGCKNGTDVSEFTSDTPQSEHSLPVDKTINIDNELDNDTSIDDEVIVVRRQTQTVRAIEPRTGGERWNFSVGQHELELVSQPDCHTKTTDINELLMNLELKVIVPEGIICAVRKNEPNNIVWKHKFNYPITNAWRKNEMNQLQAIDLFHSAQWLWESINPNRMHEASTDKNNNSKSDDDKNEESDRLPLVPSIYIGMHKKQLYIQESEQLRLMQIKYLSEYIESEKKSFARIPWHPFEASSSALAVLENPDRSVATTTSKPAAAETEIAIRHQVTATSVLYGSEYVNGNGFYLYSKKIEENEIRNESDGRICDNETGNKSEIDESILEMVEEVDFDDMPKVNIVSLWYWWKEIMVISLTTALVLNVMLSQRKIRDPEVVIVERHVEIKVPATPDNPPVNPPLPMPVDNHHETKRSLSESHTVELAGSAYISRFQTDFDMLQCLGKGGFGVVFEVKNKLDDCNYAVKRIVLPSKKESRERVMREVKTLANCEHQNIVRYFQAWVEAPPPGWQEKEDQIWMDRDALSHSIDIDSPSSELPPPYFQDRSTFSRLTDKVHSVSFHANKLNSLISNLNTNECVNFDDVIRKTTFNGGLDDCGSDDDSFIQFKAEDDESNNEESFAVAEDKDEAKSTAECKNDISDSDEDEDDDDDADEEDNDDELSNSVFSSKKHDLSDSYSGIEFRHSIDSKSKKSNCRLPFQNLKNSQAINIVDKKNLMNIDNLRSFSLGNDSCISVLDSAHFKTNGMINNNGFGSSQAMQPFRRTHRRPLSLDLTSTGKVARKFNPPTPPTPRMYLYIQMQLCRKESLREWLLKNDDTLVRQNESLSIFRQIVEAVEYVHLKGLIHRDLKPSNIFFALDGQIKIGDFGLVTDMSDSPKAITPCGDETGLPSCAKHTEQVGTHLYMSPEQLRGRQYSYKVDIYSLGLIFFELLVAFGTEMERVETLKALRSSKFPSDFTAKFNDEYNLLKLMLSKSPAKRPTTYGIRGRPPFGETTDAEYHFELPPRRRDSQNFGSFSSSSNNSSSINLKKSK